MRRVSVPVDIEELFDQLKKELIFIHRDQLGNDAYSRKLHQWANALVGFSNGSTLQDMLSDSKRYGPKDIVRACGSFRNGSKFANSLYVLHKPVTIKIEKPPGSWREPANIVLDSYGSRQRGRLHL